MIFGKKTDSERGAAILSDYGIFDIHTHILPSIDDGSADVEESKAILSEMSRQGVKKVIATPHYYPSQTPPDVFLEKREKAFNLLENELDGTAPVILKGAEVLYFRGMSRMDSLRKLCAEGTNTLLLEMPTDSWSEYMLREIAEMAVSDNIDIVMAHIERYFDKQPSDFFDQLLSMGIKFQINSSSLLGKQRRKLIKMLGENRIHFIGSDCHNMTARPVTMAEAADVINLYAGEEALGRIAKNCSVYFK